MKQKISILCLVLLAIASCSDSDLAKVAKGLDATAIAMGTLQTAVVEANKLGQIPEQETGDILRLCLQINLAGKDATAITRTLSKLENPSKAQLLTILDPIIAAVERSLNGGLLGVQDEALKAKIRGLLLEIQTTLNTIKIILASGG